MIHVLTLDDLLVICRVGVSTIIRSIVIHVLTLDDLLIICRVGVSTIIRSIVIHVLTLDDLDDGQPDPYILPVDILSRQHKVTIHKTTLKDQRIICVFLTGLTLPYFCACFYV